MVAVGGDAVLRGRGAVNSRSPVGTAEGRQDAAGFQGPGRAGHQFAEAGHARGGDAVDAQAVHADDDDARAVPGARGLGEGGGTAGQRHNKRQQFCFGAHIIFGSERESDGTATFTQLSSPAEPRGTRRWSPPSAWPSTADTAGSYSPGHG